MQIRFISTRSRSKYVAKRKNNDKMRMLSTRTSVNDVAKHKNECKRGYEAYEQRQLRLLSRRTTQIVAVKQLNKGKYGC